MSLVKIDRARYMPGLYAWRVLRQWLGHSFAPVLRQLDVFMYSSISQQKDMTARCRPEWCWSVAAVLSLIITDADEIAWRLGRPARIPSTSAVRQGPALCLKWC